MSRLMVFSACAVLVACQAMANPLKVFILAGQSNMTGLVHTNTFAHIQMFPDTAEEFAALFDEDGSPVVLDEVQVSQWRDKIGGPLAPRYGGNRNMLGPDYPFGIYMYGGLGGTISDYQDIAGKYLASSRFPVAERG